MNCFKFVIVSLALIATVSASPSAIDVVHDMYKTCLQDFSVSCVKPKALSWLSHVTSDPIIKITEDLMIVKKDNVPQDTEVVKLIIIKI